MFKIVNNLIDIIQGGGNVDCYISTDDSEFSFILSSLGFNDIFPEEALRDAYNIEEQVSGGSYENKTGLRIDCVNIPTKEALEIGKKLSIAQLQLRKSGFVPMAKFRLYSNNKNPKNIERELNTILNILIEERQNMAFVNDIQTKAYVVLSEFYC
jgi:hypothetical protein